MRLLVLPRYGPLGASSRVRMYQYLPALRAAGVDVTLSPLLDDAYVEALYARRLAWRSVLSGYWRRLRLLLSRTRYDVVWIEKETLPWLPAWVELPLLRGVPVVADYDDAVFHRYDQHRLAVVRAVLGRKIDAVMRAATLVTSGNRYLGQRATNAGCRQVEQLPTVVDLLRYDLAPRQKVAKRPLVIGWIGSPATAKYLSKLAPALRVLAATRSIDCVAVGARADQVAGTPFRALPWSAESEAAHIVAFDIGVMPLPDEPWERGKCGYKLIQYMACGLPVVASPVGVNREIVTPGETGWLADTDEEWRVALDGLCADPELRAAMGQAGRQRVEIWYSLQAQSPRLLEMLKQLVGRERV